MDVETVLETARQKHRRTTLQQFDQLLLGELIQELGSCEVSKGVIFDGEPMPCSVGSWRGSYEELALRYGYEMDPMPAIDFYDMLVEANHNTFTAYKGGEYEMDELTPVWVANYGESGGFRHQYQGVVGVEEQDETVVLQTAEVPF